MIRGHLVGFGRSALIVLLTGWVSTAAAQSVTVGTITATLGEETRTWYVLESDGDSALDSSAKLLTRPAGFSSITTLHIQGYAEERVAVEGVLSIDVVLSEGLDDCPCSIDNSEVVYFTTSNMLRDVYRSLESELVIDSFVMIGEGSASARGTFSALLGFVERPTTAEEPDPERTLQVSGEFVIERVLVTESE